MKKSELSGSYGDITHDGKKLSVNRNGVWIDEVKINFPENILFPRVYKYHGSLFIAGQGNDTGIAWVYSTGLGWMNLGTTFGISPIAFGVGSLIIVRETNKLEIFDLNSLSISPVIVNRMIGTQGIRYITDDGILVTGDQSYNGSKEPFNLAEYTKLNDIVIGQGYNGGAIIFYKGSRNVIEPGNCRFIRAYRLGDDFKVAICKFDENKIVFLEFHLSEIRNFPLEIPIPNNPQLPIPIPNIPIPNNPIPFPVEPMIMNQQKRLEEIKNLLIRANQDISGPNAGKIVRQLAYELRDSGLGLLSKPSGNNFQGCSTDYVVLSDGRLQDVIIDSGGINIINWGEFRDPSPDEMNRFVVVNTDPGYFSNSPSVPVPNPNPTPNPAPIPNSTNLQNQINSLQDQINQIKQVREFSDAIKSGDSITLKSSRNLYLRDDWSDDIGKFDRTNAGSGETYEIVKK